MTKLLSLLQEEIRGRTHLYEVWEPEEGYLSVPVFGSSSSNLMSNLVPCAEVGLGWALPLWSASQERPPIQRTTDPA